MNKILNWTFGACFRTLGRFLAIFIVGLLLIFIGSKIGFKFPDWLVLNVNAETLVGWGINYDNGGSGLWHDCSGSTTCTSQKALTMLTDDYANRSYLVGDTTATIAKNGVTITYRYPVVKDQLYNVQIGFCANKSISDIMYTQRNFDLYPANLGNPGQSYLKLNKYLDFYLVDTYPFSPDRSIGAQCYIVTSYIVASQNTTALTLRLRNNNTSITGFSPALIGYKITTLGLYSESLEEVIDKSGIASAESVEQVQESVDKVEQEIKQTNDTITDSTSPDVSGMTDLAGYLPPGPLDSVLNLPLSILNSLNSKLSSSCSPLSLILPFVNLPLNIPCLSTIFNQIAGLNVLWESIGVILGALIMYKYLTYLYNWVDDVTSLRHTRARLFGAKSDADNWGGVE